MAIKLGKLPDWTKSSHTVQNACVEVRSEEATSLEITDSKFRWDRGEAPVMKISPKAFADMIGFVRV